MAYGTFAGIQKTRHLRTEIDILTDCFIRKTNNRCYINGTCTDKEFCLGLYVLLYDIIYMELNCNGRSRIHFHLLFLKKKVVRGGTGLYCVISTNVNVS